jgi:thiamine biosynthesis lipoprotein
MRKLLLSVSLFTFVFALSGCGNDVTFELIGDENLYLTTNEVYVEYGFIARSNNDDLASEVTREGNLDPSQSGDYQVTYTLDHNGSTETLTRNVYYREPGCRKVEGKDLTGCEIYWSSYLHTSIKLTLYYEGDEYHDLVSHIFDNVEYILEDYHELATKYDDYGINNVYAINQDPSSTHVLDHRLFDLIQFSLEHQDEVNNLFNIALGPVLIEWHNAREACNRSTDPVCEVPSLVDLQAANQYTDPGDIILDEENLTITMQENMSIDLGGVSKGYISGKVIDYLESLNISYLLNNGTSNISIGGTHPTRENGKFLLAITDPSDPFGWYAEVYLGDGDQLVTSGDYQQYFEVDDELYHHIINPNTLFPERYSRSVSIITSDPALADLYSTAIFTMSIEDGLTFVNSIDGLEAIWYTLDDTAVLSDNFYANYINELYIPIED